MDCYEDTPKTTVEKKESPIDNVLESLADGIVKLKTETLPKFESILGSVLTELEKPTNPSPESKAAGGQTSLESRLILINNDVRGITEYLVILQNRIQL